ncbi:hypothetical protein [Paenibacillus sp. FSL L8-0499]
MREMEESSFTTTQPVLASDTYGWDKLQVSQCIARSKLSPHPRSQNI